MVSSSIKSIVESLTSLEKKILSLDFNKKQNLQSLMSSSKLSDTEVRRAVSWLKTKKVLDVKENITEQIVLDTKGEEYKENGLPEDKLRKYLSSHSPISLEKLFSSLDLSKEEINVSLGLLKRENAITLNQKEISYIDKKQVKSDKETFLKSLPKPISSLSASEKQTLKELQSRKNLIKVKTSKDFETSLTVLGKQVKKEMASTNLDFISSLTPGMLKDGSWKDKKFRKFDLQSNTPKVSFGKEHPYRAFLEEIKQKFLSLGFKEMSGPIVESDFWNMDSLFMPQFHSARDIHDAYYLKNPKKAKDIPDDVLKKVKAAHETGGKTGSKGWRYNFDVERTKRALLRTHDTAICSRTLASKDLEVPGKYFQIVRCFRYDVIDSTHLADFNQAGGFIVDKDLNFRHLFWLLETLAKEFCDAEDIKIVPAYFPFTEPSASLYAKHPEMGWIEIAGSGIFRPEMTEALGVKHPVIAWGIGIDRLAMFKLKLNDIRDLFSQDLNFLRESKVV